MSGASTSGAAGDVATALVLIRSASGGDLVTGEPISRRNLEGLLPDADDVAFVDRALRGLGFAVGPVLGVSMSITAPRSTFAGVFGIEIESSDGTWHVVGADAGTDDELPLDALDGSLSARIVRIVFEPPMELHEEPTWSF